MSNVTLTIGNRNFPIACAEGEEEHVMQLGSMINEKVAAMGDSTGYNESRTLLFAALLLADELHETKSKAAGAATQDPEPAAPALPAHQLETIASRLENLASHLES